MITGVYYKGCTMRFFTKECEMKKFGFVFGLAVLLAVSGCVSTQDVLSESDLNNGGLQPF